MTPVVEDVAKAAKDFFPNFEIAKINNHLRLTKNVSEEVQRLALKTNPGVPNNVLMSNSTLPSNIAEGHPVVNIQEKLFMPTLEECLNLTEGLKTMIVVNTDLAFKHKELRQSVLKNFDLSHDEQTIENILTLRNFDLLKRYIESFGKKAIFLTDKRECRSTEIEICKWVFGQTDYILVTTPPYI